MSFPHVDPSKAIERMFFFVVECGYHGVQDQNKYYAYPSLEEARETFINDVDCALSEVFGQLYGRDYSKQERMWAYALLGDHTRFDEKAWREGHAEYCKKQG